ncbi:MAG: ABC transporter ATP-binding protein, partial [Chloroflexota bacterium]
MQQVSIGYGRKAVVKDLNLKVVPGEMVGLIGPNGCGKSTIIRALSRVITPLSGRILVGGRELTRISRRELARLVGVVPQVPLLPSAFTAFEIVLMGQNPHLGFFQQESEREREIAWRAMERTGTVALAERRVGELSGGEIQSLLIARVLAQETKTILLDEPTANLDIGRQIEVLDLIKGLCRKENLTVIAAVHDLNLAVQYCDRLILMKEGQLHAEGTPAGVITERNIREVYGAEGVVYPHPENGLPLVLLRSGNGKHSAADEVVKERDCLACHCEERS